MRYSDALTELGLKRYCCRRMVLTHVDLIEKLLQYNRKPMWPITNAKDKYANFKLFLSYGKEPRSQFCFIDNVFFLSACRTSLYVIILLLPTLPIRVYHHLHISQEPQLRVLISHTSKLAPSSAPRIHAPS